MAQSNSSKQETVEEFLARGGTITKCPTQHTPDPVPTWDKVEVAADYANDDEPSRSAIQILSLDDVIKAGMN